MQIAPTYLNISRLTKNVDMTYRPQNQGNCRFIENIPGIAYLWICYSLPYAFFPMATILF
jgi:hypothetical protein